MTIGERIREKRNEMGWGLRELARRMGYKDHSTVAKIETGKIDIPLSKVEMFAEVLRTTPAYLMGWEDEEKSPANTDGISENRKKLMQFVETVPEDKAEMILRVMKSILQDG